MVKGENKRTINLPKNYGKNMADLLNDAIEQYNKQKAQEILKTLE